MSLVNGECSCVLVYIKAGRLLCCTQSKLETRMNSEMVSVRPRPASISIPTSKPTSAWSAIRSPTPRRATYPSPIGRIDSVSVPAVSYWDPDTPSPFTWVDMAWPKSPANPFLAPKNEIYALSHRASPLIPASPLSIFDQALSPTSVTRQTFLVPSSPLPSPRFLFPCTPPPCPSDKKNTSFYDVVADIVERKGSVASVTRMREAMRLEFYQFLFLKKQQEIETSERLARGKESSERCDESIISWKIQGLLSRSLFNDTKGTGKAEKIRGRFSWKKGFSS
jgi:hypothetical protein